MKYTYHTIAGFVQEAEPGDVFDGTFAKKEDESNTGFSVYKHGDASWSARSVLLDQDATDFYDMAFILNLSAYNVPKLLAGEANQEFLEFLSIPKNALLVVLEYETEEQHSSHQITRQPSDTDRIVVKDVNYGYGIVIRVDTDKPHVFDSEYMRNKVQQALRELVEGNKTHASVLEPYRFSAWFTSMQQACVDVPLEEFVEKTTAYLAGPITKLSYTMQEYRHHGASEWHNYFSNYFSWKIFFKCRVICALENRHFGEIETEASTRYKLLRDIAHWRQLVNQPKTNPDAIFVDVLRVAKSAMWSIGYIEGEDFTTVDHLAKIGHGTLHLLDDLHDRIEAAHVAEVHHLRRANESLQRKLDQFKQSSPR